MKRNLVVSLIAIVTIGLLALTLMSLFPKGDDEYSGWAFYAGTNSGNRYSSGDQITRKNVNQLQLAWTYDSKDSTGRGGAMQTNPIIIDGVLFSVSPQMRLFAVDAATGKEKWVFAPTHPESRGSIRGLSYWKDEKGTDQRIIYASGAYMYQVNALTGKIIKTFGENGVLDLRKDIDVDDASPSASAQGNAAAIIYKNVLITGMRVSEGTDALPGHIRGFDVRTGKRLWIFHTIPHPGEPGYETWEDKDAWKRVGGANCWGGMALDEKRGIVYIPTGSATPDFYGGNRLGANLYANSLIALEAATGKYIWHFQVVHHDMWDRDLPSNPNLVTVKRDGKSIDAVAQITKQGQIFLFDRTNGKPVFPINEVPVQATDVPGDKAWPTQPVATLPEPFVRQAFLESDISDRTPEIHAELSEQFKKLKTGEQFIPFGFQGAFVMPGFDGGGEWGGAAVDPESQIMYVNASEIPWWSNMQANPALNPINGSTLKEVGKSATRRYCVTCHGAELQGKGKTFPSLADLNKRMTEPQLRSLLENGKSLMPAFKQIPENEKTSMIAYLLDQEDKEAMAPAQVPGGRGGFGGGRAGEPSVQRDKIAPYTFGGYHKFYDKDGYPGIKPPWGSLNAVNLSTGKRVWKIALGEFEALKKQGLPPTGTEVYGGPVVTKGGLVFVASTQDEKIRAFDKTDGKLLWEAKLPAAGYATPSVYTIKGRQFIVIAAGGGKLGSPVGSQYVAFALPDKK